MRPALHLFAVAFLIAPALNAGDCAPATINVKDRNPITGAYVESETIEKVVYYLSNPRDAHPPKSELSHDKYLSIDYADPEDGNLLKARVLEGNGEFDKAADFFRKATTSAKWEFEIEEGYLRAAECSAKAGKADDALSALKEFGDKFPKTVHQAELVSKRGQLKLIKGDYAGADADFKEMIKHPEWTATTVREGMLGQRNVLHAQKKFAEAVAVLVPYFAKLTPAQTEDLALVGVAIAEDQQLSGKGEDALATCKKLYLAGIGSEGQCRAHLMAAKILAEANQTAGNLAAFDHAALAANLGADNDTEAAAIKLARELIQRIDKDKTVSDQDRAEYRSYSSSF